VTSERTEGGKDAAGGARPSLRIPRVELRGARDDRLFFAEVREDPLLELEAFAGHLDGTIAVVSSGGCIALSLAAAGASQVAAVDLNRTQNHIVELKAVVIAGTGPEQALAFLGGTAAPAGRRLGEYPEYRGVLSDGAGRYWDEHSRAIGRGVLTAGVSERLIGGIAWVIRRGAHPRSKIERFLACESLDEQRAFYDREWNTARWRTLIHLMANRMVLRRAYDPAFFQYVENPSFARHFLATIERALVGLPIRDNYFFHQMFLGYYRTELGGSAPPYLAPASGTAMPDLPERLTIVDGSFIEYLRGRGDGSMAGFSLSNICEWLTADEIDELFGEIVRTARPGARLCFRNFLGWTEVPQRWRETVREDAALGERLISSDRSMMQRRIAICTVN
jgi:S-adenosylmethionine-diacylglycerol 3-amino-3-carboxypropyl transferase